MNDTSLPRQITELAAGPGSRAERAERIAQAIRRAGGYRWVGIYDVLEKEIGVIGWSGPSAPTHPRFPRSQGLCGAAVASGETVIANDVSRDSRYLATLGDTRAEMIVPVRIGPGGRVAGLVDIESERVDAFGETDRAMIVSCATSLGPLWKAETASA